VIKRARARAQEAGLGHRARFEVADIDEFTACEPFDAVVGRYVLLYLPDPAASLCHLRSLVHSGGLLAFHEVDFGSPVRLYPEAPLWEWALGLLGTAFRAVGTPPDFGKRLTRIFLDAGLGFPTMRATSLIGGGPGSFAYPWLAECVRTLLPVLERENIVDASDVDIDSLAERLEAESMALGCEVITPTQFGAWTVT
jgi:hypothetical protein